MNSALGVPSLLSTSTISVLTPARFGSLTIATDPSGSPVMPPTAPNLVPRSPYRGAPAGDRRTGLGQRCRYVVVPETVATTMSVPTNSSAPCCCSASNSSGGRIARDHAAVVAPGA